jgi:hypothetical protein
MNQLISLMISAVLLCPMWANAQVQGAAPKILDDMTWVGSLWLPDNMISFVAQQSCSTVSGITLSIQLPHNNSAIFPVNGFITCNGSLLPIAGGTMVGVASSNTGNGFIPASSGLFIGQYLLTLQLPGSVAISCQVEEDFTMFCGATYYYSTMSGTAVGTGGGSFTYQPSQ